MYVPKPIFQSHDVIRMPKLNDTGARWPVRHHKGYHRIGKKENMALLIQEVFFIIYIYYYHHQI